MKIESKTDGEKGIDITIIIEKDDEFVYKETMISIKLTIKTEPDWMITEPLGELKKDPKDKSKYSGVIM